MFVVSHLMTPDHLNPDQRRRSRFGRFLCRELRALVRSLPTESKSQTFIQTLTNTSADAGARSRINRGILYDRSSTMAVYSAFERHKKVNALACYRGKIFVMLFL